MYAVDPDGYLAGASFGSSIFTEMYDTGIVCYVLLSLLFSSMIVWVEKKVHVNSFFRFACLVLVSHFVISARNSYFPNLYGIVKLYIFYTLILYIAKRFINPNNDIQ